MIARLLVLTGTLAALLLGGGCQDEEILLARLPPVETGGATELARCVETAECGAGFFCARAACNDAAGACQARPVLCEEDAAPVCGCDGITYWNDCVRRAAGVVAMRPGECGDRGKRCTSSCPNGAVCARLFSFDRGEPGGGGMHGDDPNDGCPSDANADVPGTCWALPVVCPDQRVGPDRWDACGAAPARCVTTCDAIRSGRPHERAITCAP